MTACPTLGAAGIAQTLRALDCRTGEATAYTFGRLFGADGRLLPALTLLLTLYVAFFAIGLLTGRTRIGVASLTPRMLTMGLVLTFATSWAAYQNVIWTLTADAPDEVATLLAGTHGSAVTLFADRLDQLFAAVATAADAASKPAAATATGITPATPMVGAFTASTVLWLSALLLLLGTVGVLVTAKIALAALLAVGPLFIVLALFRGSRGLFEGWLKGMVLFALVPLFAVLLGGAAVVALQPIVGAVAMDGAEPSTRAVAALFLGATVYCALMVMALKTAGTLVSGWRLPFGREPAPAVPTHMAAPGEAVSSTPLRTMASQNLSATAADDRVRSIVAALPAPAETTPGGPVYDRARRASAQIVPISDAIAPPQRALDPRLQGVGSRFRERPVALAREKLS